MFPVLLPVLSLASIVVYIAIIKLQSDIFISILAQKLDFIDQQTKKLSWPVVNLPPEYIPACPMIRLHSCPLSCSSLVLLLSVFGSYIVLPSQHDIGTVPKKLKQEGSS